MQTVIASDKKTYAKKTHSVVVAKVKTEKEKMGRTKPMKSWDLDDVIRVAEHEVYELYAKMEVLKFKAAAPPELCVREHPTIALSIGKMEDELIKAKNRLNLLQLEKEVALKKKRKQKK